jgi:predicted RNase H-like HicB family nuclease
MERGWPIKYKVALKKSDEGYSVSVSGLPGCWSQGGIEPDALAIIEEAIREYLEVTGELVEGSELREIEIAV